MQGRALPLTAFHSGPSTSSLPVSRPPFGRRDTKGERTLARPILFLSAWATAPTVGSRFLLFPGPGLPLGPQTSVYCRPGAALSPMKATCPVRLRRPERARLPSAPAPVWRGSHQPRCWPRIHGHIEAGGPVLSAG